MFGVTVLVYKNNRPNRILSAFFFLVSLVILFQYLLKFEYWLFDFPFTLFVPDIANVIIGPVLFLYSRQLIHRKWENTNYLHFVPAILFIIYFVFFEYLPEPEFVYYNYINTNEHMVVLSIILASNIAYLILFYNNYKKCEQFQKRAATQMKKWLRILLVFFVLQMLINFLIWNLHFNLQQLNEDVIANARQIKDIIFIILNAIIIFTTSFFVIANPEVISSLGTKISNKLKSYSIPETDAQKCIARLEKLMTEEKVYIDSQLNEKLMAEKLGVQTYYLSKIMNDHLKCSFKEYINRARIQETQRLLENENSNDLTLFAIAVDSGFSSESVFYSNFKKFVGMTPNQYKKKVAGKK